eukprot:3938185-Rhodomonas_salina.1
MPGTDVDYVGVFAMSGAGKVYGDMGRGMRLLRYGHSVSSVRLLGEVRTCPMLLRVSYAMSGTGLMYGATRVLWGALYSLGLRCYACGTRYSGLTSLMLLRMEYAATHRVYAARYWFGMYADTLVVCDVRVRRDLELVRQSHLNDSNQFTSRYPFSILSYAISGTDVSSTLPIDLHVRYAMLGTDIAYATTRRDPKTPLASPMATGSTLRASYAMSGIDAGCICFVLHTCYALSGTDIGHASRCATRWLCSVPY